MDPLTAGEQRGDDGIPSGPSSGQGDTPGLPGAEKGTPPPEVGEGMRLPLWMPARLDAEEWDLVFPWGYVLHLEEESPPLRR